MREATVDAVFGPVEKDRTLFSDAKIIIIGVR